MSITFKIEPLIKSIIIIVLIFSHCFECKKIRDKENYLKYKPEGDRRGNPELYNISWGEIRRRMTKIEKDGLIKLIKKYERNKI